MRPSSEQQHLDVKFLLLAYSHGYFPMADSRSGTIRWHSPSPRAIIPLDSFHASRSLRRIVRRGTFEIRIDTSFSEVIHSCAERDDTWISDEIIRAYVEFHEAGYAHSVEAWKEGKLVGGLYGVALQGAFFGESMFTREADASKVALVHLVDRLLERRFRLLDTQLLNPHVEQFGAVEIPRSEYLLRLEEALRVDTSILLSSKPVG